jgi:hypothetical protein
MKRLNFPRLPGRAPRRKERSFHNHLFTHLGMKLRPALTARKQRARCSLQHQHGQEACGEDETTLQLGVIGSITPGFSAHQLDKTRLRRPFGVSSPRRPGHTCLFLILRRGSCGPVAQLADAQCGRATGRVVWSFLRDTFYIEEG